MRLAQSVAAANRQLSLQDTLLYWFPIDTLQQQARCPPHPHQRFVFHSTSTTAAQFLVGRVTALPKIYVQTSSTCSGQCGDLLVLDANHFSSPDSRKTPIAPVGNNWATREVTARSSTFTVPQLLCQTLLSAPGARRAVRRPITIPDIPETA